jgi:signal transduction histidine kinase
MYEGGVIKLPRSAHVLRYAGLLFPIIIIIYGILIQSGIIHIQHISDNLSLLMFSFWLLYVGTIQFFSPSKSSVDSFLRLLAYHLLAGGYLVFVFGISPPIIICWMALALVSYVSFSRLGFVFSVITLTFFVTVDIFMWQQTSQSFVLNNLLTIISVVIASLVIILSYKEIARKEHADSIARESMQRERILSIINNLADAVLSIDMKGIIRIYNAASLSLLDTNNSLNGKRVDDILRLTDQKGETVSIFKLLQSANSVIKEDNFYYAYNKDDKIRIEITMSPIRSSFSSSKKSETHYGYIIIMRDVTKAKSLEDERDEFISVISHELRTPITVVEGTLSNIQLMLSHPDVTNLMLKDGIQMAHEQTIFLASMVNDLSALSRAERGIADDKEDIDLLELAHILMNKFIDEAKTKKIHLNLDISSKLDHIYVSRLYLEELLQNLITNAIKYTKKGSVTISFKQYKNVITFSVIDTGIGISKSDQAKVFDKFYRSEDFRTRESSGTGLGLYIANKLSHKLGAKLALTSRLNFGSTFSITLPIVKNEKPID